MWDWLNQKLTFRELFFGKKYYYGKGGAIKKGADNDIGGITEPVSISFKPILHYSDYDKKELNKLLKSFKIPIHITKFLGGGEYGNAFETSKGRVVKITDNGDEAFASAMIRIMDKELKRQAKVYRIYKITDGEINLYIIEKEKVKVLDDVLSEIIGHDVDIDSFFLQQDKNKKFIEGEQSEKDVESRLDSIYNKIVNYLENGGYELNETHKKSLKNMIRKHYDFLRQLEIDKQMTGLKMNDAHFKNIGLSHGKIVCFDCISEGTGKTY